VRAPHSAGSALALVAWTEPEDPHWFGAKIPADLKSMEVVTVNLDSGHQPWFSHQDFEGSPRQKTLAQTSAAPSEPAAFLLSQSASGDAVATGAWLSQIKPETARIEI
jgi:hypothetical protein